MDKRAERSAIGRVFGSRAAKAIASERPDFIIQNETFTHGIEVTELYASAIDAKLQNVPSYTAGLLEDTRKVHRKDRDILRVESITIEHKDGSGKIENVRALFQRNPTPLEKFSLLAEIVNEKATKHKDYLNNCDLVDLVVLDRSYLFGGEGDAQLLTAQLAENRDFLVGAPFREIFILARTLDPPAHFYYPVRGNVFLIDALLFDHAFLDSGGHVDAPQRLVVLARCLHEMGHSVCYEKTPVESIHVPGWQLLLKGLDLTLRNWTDLPDLQPRSTPLEALGSISDKTVQGLLTKRLAMHCDSTIALPAHDT